MKEKKREKERDKKVDLSWKIKKMDEEEGEGKEKGSVCINRNVYQFRFNL